MNSPISSALFAISSALLEQWLTNCSQIDTRSIQTVDHINLVPGSLDDGLLKTGFTNNQELGLDDFYNAYLWNYCSGNVTTDGKWEVGYCAKPKSTFYFNIYEIFKLDSDASGKDGLTADEIPANVTKVNKAIKTISNVMVGLFAVGIVATVVTFVVGWFGLLSRWGSCVTTIFAAVSPWSEALLTVPILILRRFPFSSS